MYVYVVQVGESGPVKVGKANYPKWRSQALQIGHPEELHLRYKLETGEAKLVEKRAHALLAEHRIRGEWFSVTVEEAASAIREAFAQVGGGPAPSGQPRAWTFDLTNPEPAIINLVPVPWGNINLLVEMWADQPGPPRLYCPDTHPIIYWPSLPVGWAVMVEDMT